MDALADRLARTPPEVMGPTKAMLNRAMDAAGFRVAVEAGLDLGAIINAADTPEQREWDAIVKRDGLKAALAWRDRRYDERLAESGRGEPPPTDRADRRPRPRPRTAHRTSDRSTDGRSRYPYRPCTSAAASIGADQGTGSHGHPEAGARETRAYSIAVADQLTAA